MSMIPEPSQDTTSVYISTHANREVLHTRMTGKKLEYVPPVVEGIFVLFIQNGQGKSRLSLVGLSPHDVGLDSCDGLLERLQNAADPSFNLFGEFHRTPPLMSGLQTSVAAWGSYEVHNFSRRIRLYDIEPEIGSEIIKLVLEDITNSTGLQVKAEETPHFTKNY